jgi:Asp-tRNA(Asn)/Glu-tRNA(Gln) amidotransferase A subunit family amidase
MLVTQGSGEGWAGLACGHVVSISVRDSTAMLDATAGPELGGPYVVPVTERPFLEEVSRDLGRLRIAFTLRSIWKLPSRCAMSRKCSASWDTMSRSVRPKCGAETKRTMKRG